MRQTMMQIGRTSSEIAILKDFAALCIYLFALFRTDALNLESLVFDARRPSLGFQFEFNKYHASVTWREK